MTKEKLKMLLDKDIENIDEIDYLYVGDKIHNALEIEHTNRGYSIISYYKPINHKHHNDPSNDL